MTDKKNGATKANLAGGFRPKFALYHPNGKGTGCALELALHPAHDDTDGSIMARFAPQLTVGDRTGETPVFPRFDWEHAMTVKLGFDDLCKILQVLRGECESIDDGRGLYHRSAKATTRIVFRHLIDPVPGYSFELYRSPVSGEESRVHFMFKPAEALGLCESISGVLSVICFGVPMVVPRGEGGVKNEAAA